MDAKRKAKLEKAGWKFGDYADFLGMTKKERAEIESVLATMVNMTLTIGSCGRTIRLNNLNIGVCKIQNTFQLDFVKRFAESPVDKSILLLYLRIIQVIVIMFMFLKNGRG